MTEPVQFFVWRFDETEPYRVRSTNGHNLPSPGDRRCVHVGLDYHEALAKARDANRKEGGKAWQLGRKTP